MLALLASLVHLTVAPPFSFTPPPGFHPDPVVDDAQTAALAPAVEGEPERHLAAYFDDGEGPSAASLALSTVEAPLQLEPSERQVLAAATAAHFKRRLDLPFELDHAAFAGQGAARRVEVWGAITLEGHPRTVGVAFFPGQRSYTVAMASFPVERATELTPQMEGAFDGFVAHEAPEPWARSRTAISLTVWGLAGLLLAGYRLAQRNRAPRDQTGAG
jgi:hypothetical protein